MAQQFPRFCSRISKTMKAHRNFCWLHYRSLAGHSDQSPQGHNRPLAEYIKQIYSNFRKQIYITVTDFARVS